MTVSDIVIVSGSPSPSSRSEKVLHYIGDLVGKGGYSVQYISVTEVESGDLLFGNVHRPKIKEIAIALEEAKGVIVGTPVYKASYTGVLKALFDMLPQDILQDTPVLPLMTGGSPSHQLALEYAFKPLLATMKGQNLKGLYMVDSQLDKTKANPIMNEAILNRTKKQLAYFLEKLKEKEQVLF